MNRSFTAPSPAPHSAAPLSERAYGTLLRMIQERDLPSGAAVVEQQLAERIGVSRTPLRQALQRLEIEGLLQKDANKSYVVRRVELKEYLQSLKARELVEAEAAALSVARVRLEDIDRALDTLRAVQQLQPYDMLAHWRSDEEVHGLFIRNCGNEVLMQIVDTLRVTTKLFEIERLAERLEPDSQQHERILEALRARDAKAARRAVAAHIRSLFQFAVQAVG